MKKTLSVIALLLSLLAVLSFGVFTVNAAESEESVVSETSTKGETVSVDPSEDAVDPPKDTTDPSKDETSVSGNASSEDITSEEVTSEDSSAAAEDDDDDSDKKKFPWALVIFLVLVVIAVVVCFICIKVDNKFGRWLKNFFKDYKSEIKKVTWPSREITIKSTIVVIVCLVVSGLVVGLLDFGLAKLIELFKYLVSK